MDKTNQVRQEFLPIQLFKSAKKRNNIANPNINSKPDPIITPIKIMSHDQFHSLSSSITQFHVLVVIILNEPFAEGTVNEKCHLPKNAMNTLSAREKVKPLSTIHELLVICGRQNLCIFRHSIAPSLIFYIIQIIFWLAIQ